MRTLKEISHDTYYKMERYHQITIDFVQEAEQHLDFVGISGNEEIEERLTEIGALQYQIGVALEIFNPEFDVEISDLIDVRSHLEIGTGKLISLKK